MADPQMQMPVARSPNLDELIIGTNSSSIVSKRSVERLYHPNEPHFFRYFVKRFQRRAPLINRGYWLRLRVINTIVRHFISQKTHKRKVIINLGCGSDILPWQCYYRYNLAEENIVFVDVDHLDLMLKKRSIVLETPQLSELLGANFKLNDDGNNPLLLQSGKYCQIGCDLRQLNVLHAALASLLPLEECLVLFVAEVSVTYMDTKSADALIQWASSIGQSEFCLLEQILPQGSGHPFAKTMLEHFEKLGTPPRSVGRYPNIKEQAARFKSRGWPRVAVWDLWSAWSDNYFVSDSERQALDDIEPFDEWEEFYLFARHYFILHASATSMDRGIADHELSPLEDLSTSCTNMKLERVNKYSSKAPKRRFGGATIVTNVFGQQHILHMMGLDAHGRTAACDVFSPEDNPLPPKLPLNGPSARVSFSITDLGDAGALLAGGRSSPTCALSDCWLLRKGVESCWELMPRLPVPLFRHSAVRLGNSFMILIMGGKTGSSLISGDCFVFDPDRGSWLTCLVSGLKPQPTFSAIVCNASTRAPLPGVFHGLLSGGINKFGQIAAEKYLWCVDVTGSQPIITFSAVLEASNTPHSMSLFGSQVVDMGFASVICGGVGKYAEFLGQSMSTVTISDTGYQILSVNWPEQGNTDLPLMIGCSAVRSGEDILIVGGGATCFSMGTYWETGVFRIRHGITPSISIHWTPSDRIANYPNVRLALSHKFVTSNQNNTTRASTSNEDIRVVPVRRIRLESTEHFNELLCDGKPIIIQGHSIGSCVQKWTPKYLVSEVGPEKTFVVHECSETETMDFNAKNFNYVTESFENIIAKIQAGKRLYLRALSGERPTELPAKFEEDFPRLAPDFTLPPELRYVKEHLFSSILRISGKVNMWLHYDVMANVYIQISGSRNMILFPPEDVRLLSFYPGASSSSLDVFSALTETASRKLVGTHPHLVDLHPGDILLLPPLWLHSAKPMTDMSVALNIFFRDMSEKHYSHGRDVYGNRDLEVYEKGRQLTARIWQSCKSLPIAARKFYLGRLANELQQIADNS